VGNGGRRGRGVRGPDVAHRCGAARGLPGVMEQNQAIAQTSGRQCINRRSPRAWGTRSRRFGCNQRFEDAWERPLDPAPLLGSTAALLAETHLLGER